MRRDAKFHANHGGDPATCPELPSEALRFGTALQQGRQAGELLGGQVAGRPVSKRTGAYAQKPGLAARYTHKRAAEDQIHMINGRPQPESWVDIGSGCGFSGLFAGCWHGIWGH
jgi:hypothetical protein